MARLAVFDLVHLLHVAKRVCLGQIKLCVEIARPVEDRAHIMLAGHFVKEARNVIDVHLIAHYVVPMLNKYREANEQQEGIVELGQ